MGRRARNSLLRLAVIILSVAILCKLALRLAADIHVEMARISFANENFDNAETCLNKAAAYRPDDYKIQQFRGNVCLKQGEKMADAKQSVQRMRQAKSYFLSASKLNPLEAEVNFNLAITESRLEQLHHYLYPDRDNPYSALPFFEKAILLRPNGIAYNYSKAKYLFRKGIRSGLRETVGTLARIYPPIYRSVKKEDFWQPEIKDEFINGLQKAIDSKNLEREAHLAISSIMAEKGRWHAAISHYNQAIQTEIFKNRPEHYLTLGGLYLKNREKPKAKAGFLTALEMSHSKNRLLKKIHRKYEKEKLTEDYIDFYETAADRFYLGTESKILVARELMKMGRLDRAKKVLSAINETAPTAVSWFWTARAFQKEKDWDNMELAIQKAVVLEPGNDRYHYFFSTALKNLGKLDRAEEEADLAIQHQQKPTSAPFILRASIRWAKKNHYGAVIDYQTAVSIDPGKAWLHAKLAESFIKTDNLNGAIESYRKALEIDPENNGYKSRIETLIEKSREL